MPLAVYNGSPAAPTHPPMHGAVQVYVWGRRHQYVNLSFLGIFTFTAPYLPWVLLAFSGALLLGCCCLLCCC